MTSNYLQILGLAQRAGKCSMGEEAIIKSIQSKQAQLILLASDISQKTRKKIIAKCKTYDIPAMIIEDRKTLGHSVGKQERVAIAILDKGFAHKIQTLLM